MPGSSSSRPDSRPRSRVQFSDEQGSSGAEASPRVSRTGASSPHSRKTNKSATGGDARRRVRSLGAKSMLPDTSHFGSFQSKRSAEVVRESLRDTFGFSSDPALSAFGPGALSDEYDLCESCWQTYRVMANIEENF